jgi:hypothetical protein
MASSQLARAKSPGTAISTFEHAGGVEQAAEAAGRQARRASGAADVLERLLTRHRRRQFERDEQRDLEPAGIVTPCCRSMPSSRSSSRQRWSMFDGRDVDAERILRAPRVAREAAQLTHERQRAQLAANGTNAGRRSDALAVRSVASVTTERLRSMKRSMRSIPGAA